MFVQSGGPSRDDSRLFRRKAEDGAFLLLQREAAEKHGTNIAFEKAFGVERHFTGQQRAAFVRCAVAKDPEPGGETGACIALKIPIYSTLNQNSFVQSVPVSH